MRIREDTITRPDGQPGMYGVVETNDSVKIIAVRGDKKICFLDIYRYPSQQWSLQTPGGGGDRQDPLEAAKRELSEETGLLSDSWHQIGPGMMLLGLLSETMYTFVAKNVQFKKGLAENKAAEGINRILFLSDKEIEQKILSGEIISAQTIAALHMYNIWLKHGNT